MSRVFTGLAANYADLLTHLREVLTGVRSSITPAIHGSGNVGSGRVTMPVILDASAPTETWTLTCTTAAAGGGVSRWRG